MKLFNSGIVIRITALWAFSEAFLGGILHGFKIPFAGLALSLIAAICMSLLAVHDNRRGVILKATLVVLAVKFILSPHTPPMAYVAVLIEGLAGELFFLQRRFIRTASFFLTLFCLMYSAFQKLITLTIVLGEDFWKALDTFLNGITKTFIKQPQQYSLYLVLFYIGCYLVAGIFGGILNSKIIAKVQSGNHPSILDEINKKYPNGINVADGLGTETKKRKKIKWQYFIAAILLLLLILSYTPLFAKTGLKTRVIEIVLRGALIIFAWTFLLSPLLIRWISKWVESYKSKSGSSLQEVLSLLPDVKRLVQVSWEMAVAKNKLKRISHFISNTMLLIVYGR
jgi:hypothetical protein